MQFKRIRSLTIYVHFVGHHHEYFITLSNSREINRNPFSMKIALGRADPGLRSADVGVV
jgi:hypothetical protein